MSRLRVIILPLTVLLSIVSLWIWVKPIYQKTRNLSLVEKQGLESQLNQEKELQERINKLAKEEETLGQNNLILNALPEDKEVKNLLAQLEFIVQKEKMILKRISIEDEKNTNPTFVKKTEAVPQNSCKDIEGDINVEGSYNQFKSLLKDINKLDRVTNVMGIIVRNVPGGSEEGGTKGDFTISIKAFWQESVSPESVKTSLESSDGTIQKNTPSLNSLKDAPSLE